MRYSQPTQMLVDEHAVITSVLDAVEVMANQTDVNGDFPQAFFEQAFDFFPVFADQCHHAKEEQHLFPLIEARGVPRENGPIGCMLSEHDEGRAHVRAVKAALERAAQGDAAARQIVCDEARAYVRLLRGHIFKENNVLFRLSDQAMSSGDKEKLYQKFQCVENHHQPGLHDRYVALARALCAVAQGSATVAPATVPASAH
jgi:hemerythrin-like domain-containing protein